jgi:hypothetical protein
MVMMAMVPIPPAAVEWKIVVAMVVMPAAPTVANAIGRYDAVAVMPFARPVPMVAVTAAAEVALFGNGFRTMEVAINPAAAS